MRYLRVFEAGHICKEPLGGLLIQKLLVILGVVLKGLEVILVFLGVVLEAPGS